MTNLKRFFERSILLDHLSLKPLSHIRANWELIWEATDERFRPGKDSYATEVNELIEELGEVDPPRKYHKNEDCLAEYVRDNLNWGIEKVNGRWVGADYSAIIEQGGYDDIDEQNLVLAAAGRIKAALDRNQLHFDEMEESHQKMLAAVIAVILYHRTDA